MSTKRWRESSPHMQECKIKIENEPKMQANMQSVYQQEAHNI